MSNSLEIAKIHIKRLIETLTEEGYGNNNVVECARRFLSTDYSVSDFVRYIGSPAIFNAGDGEQIYGFITDIKIHKVDGITQFFVGANETNTEGVAAGYFNPNEVTILNP